MFNNFVRDAQGFCVDTIATKFSSLHRKKSTNQRKFIEKKKKKAIKPEKRLKTCFLTNNNQT